MFGPGIWTLTLKRTWNVAPVLKIVQKISEIYCLYLDLSVFGDLMSCDSKDISKMLPLSCINTHHDVTDVANLC